MPGVKRLPGICVVVLAAGEGARLQPLTYERPKPMCPVADLPLIDHALGRAYSVAEPAEVAVNLHHGRQAIETHLVETYQHDLPHLSVEEPEALGTAGALGYLRDWIAGRDVLVLSSDTWCPGSLHPVAEGWDRDRVRVLVVGADSMTSTSRIAGAFMPWSEVVKLEPVPTGLWEVSWRQLTENDELEVVRWDGPWVDCGTPAQYLAANMAASGGASLVGEGAVVKGTVERTVVWPGAEVRHNEHLVSAIRTPHRTVLVR